MLMILKGKEFIITQKEYNKILNIFRKRESLLCNTYCCLSKRQFEFLKQLMNDWNCVSARQVFIKLLNDFNLTYNVRLLDFVSFNKQNIVRTFKITQLEYEKITLIKELYNLKSVNSVWAFLLDLMDK